MKPRKPAHMKPSPPTLKLSDPMTQRKTEVVAAQPSVGKHHGKNLGKYLHKKKV